MKIISELIPLDKNKPYIIKRYKGEEIILTFPLHYHIKEFELTLTLGMSGTRLVGDNMDNFTERDLAFIAPGIPHFWFCPPPSPPNAELIVVQFLPECFGVDIDKRIDMVALDQLLQRSRKGILFSRELVEKVLPLFDLLDESVSFSNWTVLMRIFDTLLNARDLCELCSPIYEFEPDLSDNVRFERVHKYILENYRKKISLSEVAAVAYLSPSAFSRYFKKRTMSSFADFVTNLRLAEATRQLLYTESLVGQICQECGFQNLSLFNRMFKRKYQCSPQEYRRKFLLK